MNTIGIKISCSTADLHFCFQVWPENFSSLYEMGLRSFEKLFHHRPHLKHYFGLQEGDTEWKSNSKLKKIVLTLEQSLVQAVAVFADPAPAEPIVTPEEFATYLQEIGGFHRAVVPNVDPENFIFLFKLLPEVICDVTSSFRVEGPLSPEERVRLLGVWQALTGLMSDHIISGWERRVVPRPESKFYKLYRSAEVKVKPLGRSPGTSTSSAPDESTSASGGEEQTGEGREKGRRWTEPFALTNNGGADNRSAENVKNRRSFRNLPSFDDIDQISLSLSINSLNLESNAKNS